MPCYQGTGLGCPVALLAGFPSKLPERRHEDSSCIDNPQHGGHPHQGLVKRDLC